jgi:hypothetical protein
MEVLRSRNAIEPRNRRPSQSRWKVVGLSQMGVQALDGYCNGAARANKNFFACDERDIFYSERFLLLQHVESEVSG